MCWAGAMPTRPSSTRTASIQVVGLITEWQDATGVTEQRTDASDLGGTMRLGAQDCQLQAGSQVHQCYGKDVIVERHRHRYEVNNNLLPQLIEAGLKITGRSATVRWLKWSKRRIIHGSSRASSTRNSPPRRVTAIRCSVAFVTPRWPRKRRRHRDDGAENHQGWRYRNRQRQAFRVVRWDQRHRVAATWPCAPVKNTCGSPTSSVFPTCSRPAFDKANRSSVNLVPRPGPGRGHEGLRGN